MRNKHANLFILILIASILASCSKKTMVQADEAYGKLEYYKAAQIYEEFVGSMDKGDKAKLSFKIAECYRMSNQYKDALKWYKKAEKDKYGPEAILRQADMTMRLEDFANAIILYDLYLKEQPNDEVAKKQKVGCELALKWQQPQECILFKVENVKKLNTGYSDACATPLKKEAIIFTSNREEGFNSKTYGWTGDGFYDLWSAGLSKKRGSVSIEEPILLKGGANTPYNDGMTTMNAKGSTLYLTQCGGKDGKLTTCQLYTTERKGADEWEEPIILPFCDTAYTYGQPTLSADGNTLYFASDMPGGSGGLDIWSVSFVKKGKTWSNPLNLGPTINTDRDEMYPSIAPDGTLFFSSNGHVGMGGLDMFKSKGTGVEWTTPENLKHPLNSGGDDFSLVFKSDDPTSGYFTSNRKGGKGNDDIWEFFPVPQTFKLTGRVVDCNTKLPIKEAGVYISNDKDSNKIVLRTDTNGFYSMPLAQEVKYELRADKNEDFYNGTSNYYQSTKSLICSKELVQDFEMCRLDLIGMFNVRGILYDLDKADIRPDAKKILDDSVVSLLKRFPSVTLELGSHTDCRASHEYNRELAQRRADSAVAYIISQGIDSARLTAKGYGEDSLYIKKCKCDLHDYNEICTEFEHQQNRRTTIRITGTSYYTADQRKRLENQRLTEEQQRNQLLQKDVPPPPVDDRETQRKKKLEEKEKQRKKKEEERLEKQKERQRQAEEKKKEREEKLKKQKEEREKKKK